MSNNIYNLIKYQEVIDYVNYLEKQVAEKDKAIDKLTRRLSLTTKYKDDQKERAEKYYNKISQVRKQVCEEIREQCVYRAGTKQVCPNSSISTYNLNEILNKIEKDSGNGN